MTSLVDTPLKRSLRWDPNHSFASVSQSVAQRKNEKMSSETKKKIKNVVFHRSPRRRFNGSSSANNVVSTAVAAAAAAVDGSGVLTKMGGAAPPPENEPNASSPSGRYLLPKIMEKSKNRMGAGETGLAIRQFYYLKYKPTQAYILSDNGRGKIQPPYIGGSSIDMTFDQAKIIAKTLIEQLEHIGFDRKTFL